MTMIERISEALWNSNKPQGAPEYGELSNVDKFQVELIARDVLKAMRGLSDGMGGDEPRAKVEMDKLWNHLIDDALKEGED